LLTVAGASMLSRMRCTAGRTRCEVDPVRLRRGEIGLAARARSKRWARGVVKSQRDGERVEDLIGGASNVPALQALVVLDAHTCKGGNLFAS